MGEYREGGTKLEVKLEGWINGGRISRSKMSKCKSSGVGHVWAYLKSSKEDSLIRVE